MEINKACKIIFVLYFIACFGAEIWYLVTLSKIGDYNEYDVSFFNSKHNFNNWF
ncbi:hypothetical protein C1645_837320 [Glomus cerebriforme]|uniref:Uncharacterized protein n=1 Tax=Glomus cerebriforme TaxID=658196 RepID=A0A397S4A7_9GLOM|nr:hypothetical protein C1645_837320 [Glomus cerebriforme]